ncbi:hypothetical protein F4777DRAFT_600373 [Nemania sp. FL0916]|nr:hypothetical protein F4777DRAFT_600373 [Nemania sp. FL0916]
MERGIKPNEYGHRQIVTASNSYNNHQNGHAIANQAGNSQVHLEQSMPSPFSSVDVGSRQLSTPSNRTNETRELTMPAAVSGGHVDNSTGYPEALVLYPSVHTVAGNSQTSIASVNFGRHTHLPLLSGNQFPSPSPNFPATGGSDPQAINAGDRVQHDPGSLGPLTDTTGGQAGSVDDILDQQTSYSWRAFKLLRQRWEAHKVEVEQDPGRLPRIPRRKGPARNTSDRSTHATHPPWLPLTASDIQAGTSAGPSAPSPTLSSTANGNQPNNIQTPFKAPTRFPFHKLPPELRVMVWKHAIDRPRLIHLTAKACPISKHKRRGCIKNSGFKLTIDGTLYEQVSPLFFVNRESRGEAERGYTIRFSVSEQVRMDGSHDILINNTDLIMSPNDILGSWYDGEHISAQGLGGPSYRHSITFGPQASQISSVLVRPWILFPPRQYTTYDRLMIDMTQNLIHKLGNQDALRKIYMVRRRGKFKLKHVRSCQRPMDPYSLQNAVLHLNDNLKRWFTDRHREDRLQFWFLNGEPGDVEEYEDAVDAAAARYWARPSFWGNAFFIEEYYDL